MSVLWSLGVGMGRNLDIAPLGFEDISEWVLSYSPIQLHECPYICWMTRKWNNEDNDLG